VERQGALVVTPILTAPALPVQRNPFVPKAAVALRPASVPEEAQEVQLVRLKKRAVMALVPQAAPAVEAAEVPPALMEWALPVDKAARQNSVVEAEAATETDLQVRTLRARPQQEARAVMVTEEAVAAPRVQLREARAVQVLLPLVEAVAVAVEKRQLQAMAVRPALLQLEANGIHSTAPVAVAEVVEAVAVVQRTTAVTAVQAASMAVEAAVADSPAVAEPAEQAARASKV
jgi:hypothetical protein